LSGVPANTTAECSAVPLAATPTASDNCDATPTITYNESSTQTSNGSCSDQNYTLTRKWTATDNCGNSCSKTQVITVSDNTAPVISTIPANVTVSCAGSVPSANDAGVSASDNCGGTVTISHNADVITPGSCANRYSIARTYVATDVCGNSSYRTQTITVNDQTAPVITASGTTL